LNVKNGDLVLTFSGYKALVTEVLEAGYCWLWFIPKESEGIGEKVFSLYGVNAIKEIVSSTG